MDKARKLAEQAQTKLDEQQAKLNERAQGTGGAAAEPEDPVVEYDEHGRTAGTRAPAPPYTPPGPGSPLPPFPPTPPELDDAPPAPRTAPGVEAPPSRGPGSPIPPAPPSPMRDDDAPPNLSKGDPLAG